MFAAAGLAAVAALCAVPAAAAWPERPVTIVVPYGPGAVNDLYARFLADYLTKKFNQPFVVDNRPGAGSFVGTSQVARAEPDGYTFLEAQSIIAALGQSMSTVQFNAITDITPVAMIARASEALMVPTSINVNNTKEFFDYVRANPDSAFYGIAGIATKRHMMSDKLTRMVDAPMKAVVYNTGAAIMNDLSQGRIIMAFGSVNSVIPYIQAGTVKVIAYAGEGATADSPKAPTLKEEGIDFETYAWWGVFAPNGTPPDIIKVMNEAVNEATASPEFARLAAQAGAAAHALTPEEFLQVVKDEVQIVNDLIKETGIKPEQ